MPTGVNDGASPEGQETNAPAPGTPEHDAAMAAKYIEANTPEGQPAGQPEGNPEGSQVEPSLTIRKEGEPEGEGELILGKFKSQEELIAAYQELEAKSAPPKEGADDKTGEGEGGEAAPSEALNAVFDKAAAEFDAGGDITAETREALVAGGIPSHFIDTYLDGVRAQSAALMSEAQSLVGGADNWNAMMKWAESLPENEVDAFNKAVTDPATSSLAIQGLYARFTAQNGAEAPSVTAGADHVAVGTDIYRSKAEMTADMRDPRYASDKAFREAVASKIARSRKAGTLAPLGVAY